MSLNKTYVGNYTPANYAETKWQPFPNGRRRRREILTDELTGQKYEKYYDEVQEINNSPLKEDMNAVSQQLDESFDDEYIENGKTPQFKDYPKATEEELQDTSSARFLMYDGLAKLLDSKKMQGWLLLFIILSKIFSILSLSGRACVLRGICEAAETKFSHHSGLFGELLHIIFTYVYQKTLDY